MSSSAISMASFAFVRMRRYLVSYTTLATRAVTLLPLRWLAAWIRRYSSRREPTALRSRSTSTRG